MGTSILSSRAIIGEFWQRLNIDLGRSWVSRVGRAFDSNQESEKYAWLGQVPAMREWKGGRLAKGMSAFDYTIVNKTFEATLEVDVDDVRRDKTGQIMARVGDLAARANGHWASLLSALILNASAALCYDGQYFFSASHAEGSSGTQDNTLSVDISELPCSVHGSTTSPSPEEMQRCIALAIAKILGFKDNEGEPMNENEAEFLVMVPVSLYMPAISAVAMPTIAPTLNNVLQATPFNITVAPSARFSSWTASFDVYATGGDVGPYILQEELPLEMAAVAEGSELEFNHNKWHFGVKACRNVGYGYWQKAVRVTMT